jgi:hypothetical protein
VSLPAASGRIWSVFSGIVAPRRRADRIRPDPRSGRSRRTHSPSTLTTPPRPTVPRLLPTNPQAVVAAGSATGAGRSFPRLKDVPLAIGRAATSPSHPLGYRDRALRRIDGTWQAEGACSDAELIAWTDKLLDGPKPSTATDRILLSYGVRRRWPAPARLRHKLSPEPFLRRHANRAPRRRSRARHSVALRPPPTTRHGASCSLRQGQNAENAENAENVMIVDLMSQ